VLKKKFVTQFDDGVFGGYGDGVGVILVESGVRVLFWDVDFTHSSSRTGAWWVNDLIFICWDCLLFKLGLYDSFTVWFFRYHGFDLSCFFKR